MNHHGKQIKHVSVILVISRFGFDGWIRVLIASVPDLCILFTFNTCTMKKQKRGLNRYGVSV